MRSRYFNLQLEPFCTVNKSVQKNKPHHRISQLHTFHFNEMAKNKPDTDRHFKVK